MKPSRYLTWLPLVAYVCISCTVSAAPTHRSVLMHDVPHVQQKPDFCGEACAAMALARLGTRIDQDDVFNQSGLDPALGRGCHTADLAKALKRIGFRIGDVRHSVPAAGSKQTMEAQFKALHADLVAGVPSIVCMHYDDKPRATEHFRLILGYDARADEVIYHEPAIKNGAYQRMKRDVFIKRWPFKYDKRKWTVIRIPLKPGKVRDNHEQGGLTNADYAQHIMKLRKKVPQKGFHIIFQRPFVVVGDESAEMVKQRATGTVKWATDYLKKDYFANDPEEIIDIWLFKDKVSYQKHAREIFGGRPTTPYGYCSDEHNALVMNIRTGGGTLVHEMVHSFMPANFPACPAWFNEGLASLYEQCGERNGHIRGYTNWRLAGLQAAIRRKEVPSFKTLCSTSSREFYQEDPGTNYSQARYLCYYLQEKGLLVKYFHEFRRSVKKDPTGYQTLAKILNESDMDGFKKKWEAFVLKLRF